MFVAKGIVGRLREARRVEPLTVRVVRRPAVRVAGSVSTHLDTAASEGVPGEHLYSGQTSPGAVLPHGSTELSPIKINVDLTFHGGVQDSYYYTNRTMFGFSTGAACGPTVMPIVGD